MLGFLTFLKSDKVQVFVDVRCLSTIPGAAVERLSGFQLGRRSFEVYSMGEVPEKKMVKGKAISKPGRDLIEDSKTSFERPGAKEPWEAGWAWRNGQNMVRLDYFC